MEKELRHEEERRQAAEDETKELRRRVQEAFENQARERQQIQEQAEKVRRARQGKYQQVEREHVQQGVTAEAARVSKENFDMQLVLKNQRGIITKLEQDLREERLAVREPSVAPGELARLLEAALADQSGPM